jgi:hypothetical protein
MKLKFTTETDGFLSFTLLFCRFFFESHPVYDQTQASGAVFILLQGYLSYIWKSGEFKCFKINPMLLLAPCFSPRNGRKTKRWTHIPLISPHLID